MTLFDCLNEMRNHGGDARTVGLSDEIVAKFAELDSKLEEAVFAAHEAFKELLQDEPEILAMDEVGQAAAIQEGFQGKYGDKISYEIEEDRARNKSSAVNLAMR